MNSVPETASITPFIRADVPVLREGLTLDEALQNLRQNGKVGGVSYIYVVNDSREFTGVIPVRSLIFNAGNLKVAEVMNSQKVSIPASFTVKQALEAFHSHKFLALPVVDDQGRLAGTLDITALTDTSVDLSRRGEVDQLFETIGLRWSALQHAGPWKSFRYRFPWLVPTLISGTLCAILAGLYQVTLEKSILLSFFLTLVLGLGESVSIQALTITINRLRSEPLDLGRFFKALWTEASSAVLLGLASATLVAGIIVLWKGDTAAALSVGLTLTGALTAACLFGLAIPSLLHALKLDPKVAAGPLVLALADLSTLSIYFSLASVLLG